MPAIDRKAPIGFELAMKTVSGRGVDQADHYETMRRAFQTLSEVGGQDVCSCTGSEGYNRSS